MTIFFALLCISGTSGIFSFGEEQLRIKKIDKRNVIVRIVITPRYRFSGIAHNDLKE